MAENHLELAFPDSINKKDKEQANRYVCALLNSNGGTLTLKTKVSPDTLRFIEQNMKIIIGSDICKSLDCMSTTEVFIWKVKGHQQLSTMDYNAYLPSDTQKIPVGPHEVEQMKELLCENRIVDITDVQDGCALSFIYKRPIGTQESKTVQFKQIQSDKDLATSLFNNELNRYVSAFANYCGGALYCGVKDDGIVEGQILKDETEKERFRTSVSEYVNKMIWPEYIDRPVKQGPDGQFDISFEPVLDQDGTHMPSRYVVVIKVPVCTGGVFCDKPESYHIVDGEVKRMEFAEWKRRLLYSNTHSQLEIVSNVPLLEWNSVGTRRECDGLDGTMLRMINNGQRKEFDEFKDKIPCTDKEKELVVLSKRSMYNYRQNKFPEAIIDLDILRKKLGKADNVLIFDAREKLVRSALERSRGDHMKSYQIAVELLPIVEQLAPSILTAEFFVHFATMLTIIEANEELKKKLNKDVSPGYWKDQAMSFYHKSLQHLEIINYVPKSRIDMQQKAYINLAILSLGCSLSGDTVNAKVSKEDIQVTSTCLKRAMEKSKEIGLAMTGFRICHFNFAKAFLSYRKAQHEREESKRIYLLENAIRQAKETELLAEKYEFKELSTYARTHGKLFEDELNNTEESFYYVD